MTLVLQDTLVLSPATAKKLEQEIEDRLAEQFLEGSIPHGSVITISARDGKLTFRVYRKENN